MNMCAGEVVVFCFCSFGSKSSEGKSEEKSRKKLNAYYCACNFEMMSWLAPAESSLPEGVVDLCIGALPAFSTDE